MNTIPVLCADCRSVGSISLARLAALEPACCDSCGSANIDAVEDTEAVQASLRAQAGDPVIGQCPHCHKDRYNVGTGHCHECGFTKGASVDFGEDMAGQAGRGFLAYLLEWLRGGHSKDTIPKWFPKSYLTPEEIQTGRWSTGGGEPNYAFGSKTAEKAPTAPEGWDGAAPEACDHFEPGGPDGDDSSVCKNCWWAIGAHSVQAGGPTGHGGFGPTASKQPPISIRAFITDVNDIPVENPDVLSEPKPTMVNDQMRCSNCFHEWRISTIDPAQPVPLCPNCGSTATTPAGANGVAAVASRWRVSHGGTTIIVDDDEVARYRRAPYVVEPVDEDDDSKVAHKITEVTVGILATNPGMNFEAAKALATQTVRSYPKMVRSAAPLANDTVFRCKVCGEDYRLGDGSNHDHEPGEPVHPRKAVRA